MDSEEREATKAELRAAKDAGDISLREYLEELRRLRSPQGARPHQRSSGSAAASSAASCAPAARACRSRAAMHDDSSDDSSDLVDEDGRPFKRQRQPIATPRRDASSAPGSASGSPPGSAPRSSARREPRSRQSEEFYYDEEITQEKIGEGRRHMHAYSWKAAEGLPACTCEISHESR